jgi:hypothetical protein
MSDGNIIPFALPEEREPRSPSHVLYQVNDLLPEDQHLRTIPPSTRASDALRLMKEFGYSQLPVVHNDEVVGVFSHRSFADGVLDLEGMNKLRAEELPVSDFVEQLSFVDVRSDPDEILDRLDTDNAVLVGSPATLVGIATPMDALRYFHRITSAFLVLQEIELAIRALLGYVYSDERLTEVLRRIALARQQERRRSLTRIEDLSFGDYVQLIGNEETWSQLQDVFGTSRELVLAKLRPINELRNDAFHFRRELVKDDYDRLTSTRGWLRLRLRLAVLRDQEPI